MSGPLPVEIRLYQYDCTKCGARRTTSNAANDTVCFECRNRVQRTCRCCGRGFLTIIHKRGTPSKSTRCDSCRKSGSVRVYHAPNFETKPLVDLFDGQDED